jgi:HK97 family phage prohead protease
VFYDENRAAETEYWLWDDIVERIRPGAFDRAIREQQDVRALFNHSMDWVLGRTKSGTLRLSVDSIGLFYEVDDNESDPQWASVSAKIKRGDVDGSSFAFSATSVTWTTETRDGKRFDVRWINDLDLFDVGPVTFPAYSGSTSERSRVNDSEYRSLVQERDMQIWEEPYVAMRTRLVSL